MAIKIRFSGTDQLDGNHRFDMDIQKTFRHSNPSTTAVD